ncbi:sigma 54-interacting transcriptional regulator, partial [bacterium]|nr:sigma 54-interacting transcriptional regulator [bacterium]
VLFLDEIDSLPKYLQAKFLTALETGRFKPVGSDEEVTSNFRLICASGRDISDPKIFRRDLYHRISHCEIEVPSLKDWEDSKKIELINTFVERYATRLNKKITKLTDDAEEFCLIYNWPGNIRQMNNVISIALLFSKDGIIRKSDITDNLSVDVSDIGIKDKSPCEQLKIRCNELEEKMIVDAYNKFKENKSKAANFIGMDPSLFGKKIKEILNKRGKL